MRKPASTSSITVKRATRATDPRSPFPTGGPAKVRPFSFAEKARDGSSCRVKKQSWFRKFLFVLLGLSAVFAAVSWFLPYEWAPDAGARFRIAATQVKRDRSYYWINVHLRKSGQARHDLVKPVRLLPGQAGARQVKNARRGLVSGFGMINYDRGLGSGAAILARS